MCHLQKQAAADPIKLINNQKQLDYKKLFKISKKHREGSLLLSIYMKRGNIWEQIKSLKCTHGCK